MCFNNIDASSLEDVLFVCDQDVEVLNPDQYKDKYALPPVVVIKEEPKVQAARDPEDYVDLSICEEEIKIETKTESPFRLPEVAHSDSKIGFSI